jgi:hypothetical protein
MPLSSNTDQSLGGWLGGVAPADFGITLVLRYPQFNRTCGASLALEGDDEPVSPAAGIS